MARQARVFVDEGESGVYHVCSRVAGPKGWYPLADKENRHQLIQYLKHYSALYQCRVYSFVVMGDHYHAILKFRNVGKLSKKYLKEKALQFYPNSEAHIDLWNEDKWKAFENRLFDISELMRSLNRAYTNWYNARTNSRGSFWSNRFKSVILGSDCVIRECMLYIDLNPVRAGLVTHPDDYEGSSCHLRIIGKDKWLVSINEIMKHNKRSDSLAHYRQLLYDRGDLPNRKGKLQIPQEVKREMEQNDNRPRGVYKKKLKYFVNGVMIGSKLQIEEKLQDLRTKTNRFYYKRRKNALTHEAGDFYLQHGREMDAVD